MRGGELRVAIYGRHSTGMQNESSSADQASSCLSHVQELGGRVVGTYLDEEISGYKRSRPGLQRLLTDVHRGHIDIIVCEALDRIARDSEDISWLWKKLRYDHVRLYTLLEHEIDDVKVAVAGMLGSMFLANLQQKTLRGMQAAVIAGRFAGGRAYGYKRRREYGPSGELLPGLLEIDEQQAMVVRRIFDDFASGLSAISIAKALNESKIPSPQGGEWNASTIRGDPKKLVGILNNPLYRGELVWKRREWRKNPDSDERERRYRLRDEDQWLRVAVPDLQIVSDDQWNAVRVELASRRRGATQDAPPSHQRRRKHLLSGSIKCGLCGSNYTISGKDYYRCAGVKERGTCDNRLSIRQGPLEEAVLSTLQSQLLTPALARLFVQEFRREADSLSDRSERNGAEAVARLREIKIKIEMLAQNMLISPASPALHRLLAELEDEQTVLEAASSTPRVVPTIPSHAALLSLFEKKVKQLRAALNGPTISAQAAQSLSKLIQSVTIYPGTNPEAELAADIARLIDFAANENSPRPLGPGGCSIMVVAGAGFEPATFRL